MKVSTFAILFAIIYFQQEALSVFIPRLVKKRQTNPECRAKYPPVRTCIQQVKEGSKEIVQLAREGRIAQMKQRAIETKEKLKSYCESKISEYYDCCWQVGDCSMIKEEIDNYMPEFEKMDADMMKLTGKSLNELFKEV